jgi:hypothetical protein
MPEDSDYEMVELPDNENTVYLIEAGGKTTQRMMEVVQQRFEEVFDTSNFIVYNGDIETDDTLRVESFDSDDIKEHLDSFEDADSEADAMVAIDRMKREEDNTPEPPECENCSTDFNHPEFLDYDEERHDWHETPEGFVCPTCGTEAIVDG